MRTFKIDPPCTSFSVSGTAPAKGRSSTQHQKRYWLRSVEEKLQIHSLCFRTKEKYAAKIRPVPARLLTIQMTRFTGTPAMDMERISTFCTSQLWSCVNRSQIM